MWIFFIIIGRIRTPPWRKQWARWITPCVSGKAFYVGLSNYKPAETRQAAAILRRLGTPCLIHQPSYSLFNRWIEEGLTATLEEEGIGCIVFSPLAQGQLTDRYLKQIPQGSRAFREQFLKKGDVEKNLPRVRALHEIAQQRGQPLAEMALAWVLRSPVVTSAVIGASSTAQLDTNLKALDHLDFSEAELVAIEKALKI